MNTLWDLFQMLIFPGFLFLGVYSLIFEFLDRKMVARLQNRVGPPWYQPLADFLKLLGKEIIIPEEADRKIFPVLPVIALAAVTAAFLYVPTYKISSVYPFEGDLIVLLYLMTLPTLTFFLAGWYSTSVYAAIGSVRVLTQLFSYEVPLFMALLSPALLAGTWSLSGLAAFYGQYPLYVLINLPALVVAIIACQGKLERVPFDLPEAETEIVTGAFVEYGGRLYAIFRMAIDAELVVVSSIIAAIFLPFYSLNPLLGMLLYVLRTLVVLFVLALFRAVMARVRIEQMVMFCWRYLTPLAILQIIINLIVRGVLPL
ncbi:MAG: NADH-quinone oxidoreductase subunit H [Clostridiales bacterium]|nr:NADH-quinone oxidoreductase subunit H [Clostridiales bacterium]